LVILNSSKYPHNKVNKYYLIAKEKFLLSPLSNLPKVWDFNSAMRFLTFSIRQLPDYLQLFLKQGKFSWIKINLPKVLLVPLPARNLLEVETYDHLDDRSSKFPDIWMIHHQNNKYFFINFSSYLFISVP